MNKRSLLIDAKDLHEYVIPEQDKEKMSDSDAEDRGMQRWRDRKVQADPADPPYPEPYGPW